MFKKLTVLIIAVLLLSLFTSCKDEDIPTEQINDIAEENLPSEENTVVQEDIEVPTEENNTVQEDTKPTSEENTDVQEDIIIPTDESNGTSTPEDNKVSEFSDPLVKLLFTQYVYPIYNIEFENTEQLDSNTIFWYICNVSMLFDWDKYVTEAGKFIPKDEFLLQIERGFGKTNFNPEEISFYNKEKEVFNFPDGLGFDSSLGPKSIEILSDGNISMVIWTPPKRRFDYNDNINENEYTYIFKENEWGYQFVSMKQTK